MVPENTPRTVYRYRGRILPERSFSGLTTVVGGCWRSEGGWYRMLDQLPRDHQWDNKTVPHCYLQVWR